MRLLIVALTAAVLSSVVHAQADHAVVRPASVVSQQTDTYVYQPNGRRDPFLSLINSGTDPKVLKHDGLRTFALADISVRGIMQSKNALVAMVQGPDNKTYLIHQGDRLADAVVKSVTTQGLVVMQDVSDPLSVQKQREVRKLLRSLEGTDK